MGLLRAITWSACLAACAPFALADTPDKSQGVAGFRASMKQSMQEFRTARRSAFADFVGNRSAEMAEFMRNPWEKMEQRAPIPAIEEAVPAIPPYEERPATPRPIPIRETVEPPAPGPQPRPTVTPQPKPAPGPTVNVDFYGTAVALSGFGAPAPGLDGEITNLAIARGVMQLAEADTEALLESLLDARKRLKLCDWAYVSLVGRLARKAYPSSANSAQLLWGMLMQQSGYKVRFAYDDHNRLALYVATDDFVRGRNHLVIDGQMMLAMREIDRTCYLCPYIYPGERAMSMGVGALPLLAERPGTVRTVAVKQHPELQLTVRTNANLIDFFADYPDAMVGRDALARWANQANTEASPQMKRDLYPALRQAVAGMDQWSAVNLLLKVAQSFDYGLDEEIWHRDRTFFADESWHYPLSDCEDHAVNFTRLARDILGLDAALIFYPGHLYSAVAVTDGTARGDYVVHGGKRYSVCDPTYFYAPAGRTAPGMDNSGATLVPLRR